MTIMQTLIAAGYPREEMDHHGSDLYVYVTPLTEKVVETYYKEKGQDRHHNAPVFKDQITGRKMYDIAFGYDDWYEEKETEDKAHAEWLKGLILMGKEKNK